MALRQALRYDVAESVFVMAVNIRRALHGVAIRQTLHGAINLNLKLGATQVLFSFCRSALTKQLGSLAL